MPTETADAPPARSSFRDALASDVKTFVAETTPPKEAVVPPKETPPAATPPKVEASVTAPADPSAALDADIDSGKVGTKDSPAKSPHWDRLKSREETARKEANEFKAKNATYEKELAEARKRPAANVEEIKKIQEERDKFKGLYEVVALESSDDFNKSYVEKLNKVNDDLKAVIPADVHAKVSSILQLSEGEWKNKQLDEIYSDLTPSQQMKIGRADEKLQEIIAERKAKLDNSHKTTSELWESRQKQQQEHAEKLTKTFDEVFTKTQTDNPMFKKREGDSKEVKEWNDGITERAEIARAMYSGQLDPSDMADAALRASSYHVAISELSASRQREAEKDALIARLQGSGPAPNSGGGGDGATPKPVIGGFARQITKDVSGA